MTEQTQPTDALAKLRHLYANMVNGGVRDTASAKRIAEGLLSPAIEALEKWGTPAGAGEPDFYTACAWHEGGGEAGWIPLPGYSNETEHGVKHLVLEAARKEGYKGTAAGRLLELGWEIRPVYLAPQPTQEQAGFKSGAKSFQTYAEANAYSKGYYAGKKAATKAQAGAVPLTDEQIEEIAKQFITRVGSHWEHDDAIPDNGRIEDFVRAIEAAHGIKGADHG